MFQKTKRILMRRRVREVIVIKKDMPVTLICENCRREQNFGLAEKEVINKLKSEEKTDELPKD